MRRSPGLAGVSVDSSIPGPAGEMPTGNPFAARCIDLRRFLRDLGRVVDLVKIDVEGAEVPLLESLREADEMRRVRAMFVETHAVTMSDLRPRLARIRRRYAQVAGHLHRPRPALTRGGMGGAGRAGREKAPALRRAFGSCRRIAAVGRGGVAPARADGSGTVQVARAGWRRSP